MLAFWEQAVAAFGITLVVLGLVTEGVGFAAMSSWSLRRRLPDPFEMASLGGILSYLGLGIYGLGCALFQ